MNNDVAFSFAITLLHSLWIALAIFGIVKVLFVIVDQKWSKLRYAIASGSLLIYTVAVAVTLVLLLPEQTPAQRIVTGVESALSVSFTDTYQSPPFFKTFVTSNSHLILGAWVIGAIVFLLRLAGGLWYVRKVIRCCAEPGEDALAPLQRILAKLHFKKRIRLVQSTMVVSPLVVGVFKPLIILPAGFATGISSEQLEAVLAHELVHITRRDYLINFLQCVVESLFFFNPFVWILSELIRREREHVCDDAVVQLGFDKITYARTLAALEESRLHENVLTLSLADNKKLLLHRIKRLMEKSIKTHSTIEKLIPVVLLIVGLGCAAFLTIDRTREQNVNDTFLVQADTVKKPDKPSRPTVGTPASPSTRDVEMDIPLPLSIDIHIPEMPEIDIRVFPEINAPEIPDFPEFDASFMQHFEVDSIPFGRAFLKQFDVERLREFQLNSELNISELMSKVEAIQEQIPEMLERVQEMRIEEVVQRDLALAQEAMSRQQEALERVNAEMVQQQAVNEERMRAIEAEAQEMQKRSVSLLKALKEQLIIDGYLAPDEKIEMLQIDAEGNIRVNDIEIRESDRAKYEKIQEKFTLGVGPRPPIKE